MNKHQQAVDKQLKILTDKVAKLRVDFDKSIVNENLDFINYRLEQHLEDIGEVCSFLIIIPDLDEEELEDE